jgi:hypothetical protein
VPSVVSDLLEALGPVVAAAGEYPNAHVGEVDLNPVAVEFDLWTHRSPVGTRSIDDASAGSTKPG